MSEITLTEVLAYTSGMESERAAIIVWLKQYADRWHGPVGTGALRAAASAIEAGDHLTKDKTDG